LNFVFFDHAFFNACDLNVSNLVLAGNFQLEQRIWFLNNELPFFEENLSNLRGKASIFRLVWPGYMDDQRELLRLTKRLLNKNRFYKAGIVLFRMFWEGDTVHLLIQALPASGNVFPISDKGILLNFSEIIRHSGNPLSAYDFFNKAEWDVAHSGLKNSIFGNSVILNESGSVCEAIGANIFFFKGKTLITPSPETGCYIDPVRRKILEAAAENQLPVVESSRISKNQVFSMDEIFIVSEVEGMQWVMGIESKRYIHLYSDELNKWLNELLKISVQ